MQDDICAVATAYGSSAIAVIRCSGEDSIRKINQVFKGKNIEKVATHTIHYGNIVDGDTIIDEVMVSVFIAPRSFTAENSVEISCHGGIYTTNRVLETLLKIGFRLAEPGEFSKRAFLNKRIDLSQAEAIMDIISATNNTMLESANNNLRRQTSILVESLQQEILNIIAVIEVNIDYPEYDDIEEMTNSLIIPKLEKIIERINDIIEHSKIGQIALHGIKTAIIGRPNVGKSSILNILLEEEKAIVSKHEGTTRDLIEARLTLGNVTLNLIDTAGIRETVDEVEKIGISRSKKTIEEAQLILLVLDNSEILTPTDKELLELTKNKKRIIIVNKGDLTTNLDLKGDFIKISALNKIGLAELEKKLIEVTKINEFNVSNQNYVSNVRHIGLLNDALESLKSALNAAKINQLIDMVEIDIKNSWLVLGEILGQSSPDLLINELFSKFCLGK